MSSELQFYREENLKTVEADGLRLEIPEEWEVVRLGDVIGLKSGQYFKYSEFCESGVKCLKIDNVGFGKIIWDTITFLPKDYINKFPDLVLKEGDIVIALNRPILNNKIKVGRVKKEDSNSLLYQRVGKIVFKDISKIHNLYLFFVLLGDIFKNNLSVLLLELINLILEHRFFLRIKIPLPSLQEQQKIAHVLMSIDKAIETIDEAIKQAERIKKGLMQELLTRGIGHKEFKDTEIGRIPKEWGVVKLKDVTEKSPNSFVDGPFGSNLKVEDFTDHGIPVIQLHNVGEGFFIDNDIKYISEKSLKS